MSEETLLAVQPMEKRSSRWAQSQGRLRAPAGTASLALFAVVALLAIVPGCKKEPDNNQSPEQPKCVPVEATDWLDLEKKGCLTKNVVCSRLDPKRAMGEIQENASKDPRFAQAALNGDLSYGVALVRIGYQLEDLRIRYGCDSSLWPTVLADAAEPQSVDLAVAGKDESEGGPALRTPESLGVVTCDRAQRLARRIEDVRDEFAKKDLEEKYKEAARDCRAHAPSENLAPGQIVLVTISGVEAQEYRFDTHVLPIEARVKSGGRGNGYGLYREPWLLYPVPTRSLASPDDTSPALLVHVPEAVAREVRSQRSGPDALALQVIGRYQGTGPVLRELQDGEEQPHVAIPLALRLLLRGVPVTDWDPLDGVSATGNVPDDKVRIDLFDSWFKANAARLGLASGELAAAARILRARNREHAQVENLYLKAQQACLAALAMTDPPVPPPPTRKALYSAVISASAPFCHAHEAFDAFYRQHSSDGLVRLTAAINATTKALMRADP